MRELRGQHAEPDIEPEVQLGIPAYIPETYIPDVSQRLVVYKRLAGIRGVPDLEEIAAELEDRYGPIPPLVDTLLRVMELVCCPRPHLRIAHQWNALILFVYSE